MYAGRRTALLLVLLGVPTACSDDDKDVPAANLSTGLPQDQKLSSFDDDEAKTACQALNEGASQLISDAELVRAQCASRAISASSKVNDDKTAVTLDLVMCAELTKSCETDPVSYGVMAQTGRKETDCSDAAANQNVKQCQATVAEYEACITKLLEKSKEALAKIECNNGQEVLANDGAATKVDPQSIPECKTFLDKCPDIQIAVSIGN